MSTKEGRRFPDSREIVTTGIRDLAPDALDERNRLRLLPAAFWAETTVDERALFGHRHGLYSFPTIELVEYLDAFIGGRTAIEIGAGHGVLADALAIPGTDNFQQLMPRYRAVYEAGRQPIVPYGPNVINMHASRAVRRYAPQVVIGVWVTHKYDPARHEAGGNEIGVDEPDVLRHCEEYVFIGNETTHKLKPLWDRPPLAIEYPPFVFSRAHTGGRDLIAVWRGYRRPRR